MWLLKDMKYTGIFVWVRGGSIQMTSKITWRGKKGMLTKDYEDTETREKK